MMENLKKDVIKKLFPGLQTTKGPSEKKVFSRNDVKLLMDEYAEQIQAHQIKDWLKDNNFYRDDAAGHVFLNSQYNKRVQFSTKELSSWYHFIKAMETFYLELGSKQGIEENQEAVKAVLGIKG